jgi:hypothetical protein
MAKVDQEIQALAATLSQTVGADDNRDFTNAREFWAREPQRSHSWAALASPGEYEGQERVRLVTSDATKPQILDCWCAQLPALSGIRWLELTSRAPQRLLEAACMLPCLEALRIPANKITDLSPLGNCRSLRYLQIGTSSSITSIEPLGKLTWLRWLQLDNIKCANSLDPLSSLVGLGGLGFTGAEFKGFTVDSFQPLRRLEQLEWLHLGAVHAVDTSLQPLARLKKLTFLGLGNFFPLEEFAYLSLHFDASVCGWAQPFFRLHSSVLPCRRCNKNWKVIASGKGGRALCPSCDSLKLARHVARFNAARGAAAAKEFARGH